MMQTKSPAHEGEAGCVLLPGENRTSPTEFEAQAQCLAARFGLSSPRARLVVALLRGEVI